MKQTKAPTIYTETERDKSLSVCVTCPRMFDLEPYIGTILDLFHEAGWQVTERAIVHNFEAWQHNLRSGYRDDRNGYFLFSPYGCNPLRFNASKIERFDTTYQV